MSIPKTPIMLDDNDEFEDADGNILSSRDIARDLTEFYELKQKMVLLGRSSMLDTVLSELFRCPKCGADLTKGAKT